MNIFFEYIPFVIFFITYKIYGLLPATSVLMIIMPLILIYHYFRDGHVPKTLMISTAILLVCGSMTLLSGDSRFIKIKLTIVNLFFAFILLGGVFFGKGLLEHVFGNAIKMSNDDWLIFSRRFGLYFILMALVNEFIWRNYSDDIWVNFKLFGTMIISICFILTQIPFLMKNAKNDFGK